MPKRAAILAATALAACAPAPPTEAPPQNGTLTRIATVPLGAEVTGLFLHGDSLFFNSPHPDRSLPTRFARAAVGVVTAADFTAPATPVPQGAERAQVTTSLGPYQVLFQEGDHRLGAVPTGAGRSRIAETPDFNAFVPTRPGAGYLFTNWEARPGGMSRVRLTRGAEGWQLDPTDVRRLDFSALGGTWMNCFGTLSPWGTPLTAEELYVDDTANWMSPLHRLLIGMSRLEASIGHRPNPYRYGYIMEITDPTGDAQPVKHWALGRFSHENALVMPDRRNVYLSDDGAGTVLFRFLADRPGDLTAGTLYAAKVQQSAPPGSPAATTGFAIDWVRLAHGTEAQIAGWIAEYDDGHSFISDAEIAAWARGEAADDRVAFLESRKAAAAKGATAEFRKMEGVNANATAIAAGQRHAWLAMTEITRDMADRTGDVQLGENRCGVVYRLDFGPDFVAHAMQPALAGVPTANGCRDDALANPDNIVVRPNGDVIIGEDSPHHDNNAIWLFSPAPNSD